MKVKRLDYFLQQLGERMLAAEQWGQVATYIPPLAEVDPRQFGMSICLKNGQQLSTGDTHSAFSIQSISKVFALAIALRRHGEALWQRVGTEPSNYAFNSAVDLEKTGGIPKNPFVNAGALVTTDAMLSSSRPATALSKLLRFVDIAATDDQIYINHAVASAEAGQAHRNTALAHLLRAYDNLDHDCELVLQTYFQQCAIEMNCEQLARSGRFLAHLHRDRRLISHKLARHINALMLTAGHYDGSGQFAYSVGFPGKSGVGGGILAIVPDKASIAVWSPGLNRFGNSLLGTQALIELSEFTGWSVF